MSDDTKASYERIQRELHYMKLLEWVCMDHPITLEDPLANKLSQMREKTGKPDLSIDCDWLALQMHRSGDFHWNEEQCQVLRSCAMERVSVIMGGSGSGKTTLAHGLMRMFESFRMKVLVTAPTEHMVRSITATVNQELPENKKKKIVSLPKMLRSGGIDSITAEEDGRTKSRVWFFTDFPKAEPEHLVRVLNQIPQTDRILLIGNPADLPIRSRDDWETGGIHILKTQWIQERKPNQCISTEELFARIQGSGFRSGFSLKKKDIEYIQQKGWDVVEDHARDMIRKRLAPAYVEKDGQQTPMRGHPVFPAQHATACCCRGCLYKWYRIPKGRELTEEEQDYVVRNLMAWMHREFEK